MKIRQLLIITLLVVGLVLFGAKSIPIGSEPNIPATIVQKIAIPGYTGNNRFIICDLDGQLVRVRFDWNEKTKIGGPVRLLRLDKFLFPPQFVVDLNKALKPVSGTA